MANLIIKSNIKQAVKEIDEENSIPNIAGDVAEELNKKASELLKKGVERAKKNQRRTLYARDL
tara:strand:- start:1145 stop:1333 length:189 start_codon:yes stop_codon:yes gene_type:complete